MRAAPISIIIPTYNSALTLADTLKSIAGQSLRPLEVLIVDGLSTDATAAVAESYSDQLPVQFISEKDKGIYDAMNKAVDKAKGEWVYFLGSDDLLHDSEVLVSFSKEMEMPCDIIYGDIILHPSGKKEEGLWGYDRLLKQNINHQRIFYKKELFQKYGMYDLQYKVASDHELNIRFYCNKAIKKKYIPVKIAVYNELGFSANKIDEQFWLNWEDIILKNFSPHLLEKEVYKSLYWYCWRQVKERRYAKAFPLFIKIFLKTRDISFLRHTASQMIKSFKN